MGLSAYAKRIWSIWTHPGNQGARTAALVRAVHWRAQLSLTGAPAILRTFGDLTFRAGVDDVSRSVVYYGPWFEYDEMKFVSSYLRPGDSVLDIGANAGVYSLLAAASIGSGGHVDAIEPVAETVERLHANIRANALEDIVTVHKVAVGENEQAVEMTSSDDATNHVVVSGNGESVPCVRLDRLMNSRSYAFAKMDIEGMELAALRGSSDHLSAGNPPLWMIEVNGSLFRYGFTVAELVAWVEDKGYDIATYSHAKSTLSLTKQPWGNVFLVHRDSWDMVRSRVPRVRIEQH